MRTIAKVAGYQVRDAARSRWLLVYGVFFLVATEGLLRFGGEDGRGLLGLMNVMLFVVPLVSLLLGAVQLYNAREFTEVLLAQPVARGRLYAGLYLGLTAPLGAAFVGGVGIPVLARAGALKGTGGTFLGVMITGVALTAIFSGIAFVITLLATDRLRGLAIAIGAWLLLALVYDGLVLAVVSAFGDYAIERPLLALTFANPIDLARVLLTLRLDTAALLGYTGAVFKHFFGGSGSYLAIGALALWIAVPVTAGARAFHRKDF